MNKDRNRAPYWTADEPSFFKGIRNAIVLAVSIVVIAAVVINWISG